MIRQLISGVCLCLWITLSEGMAILELNGTWSVINRDRGLNISGTVPGSMYTALLGNKIIQDPYYRNNDDTYRWIGNTNWTFWRTFELDLAVLEQKLILLVCEGLDTYATVYINGKVVGKSSNMFLRFEFNITNAVQKGTNSIMVEFRSAVGEAALRTKTMPYDIPPDCSPPEQHGECHVNMLRKEQCSFSWDWGPSFPTQGIWKQIYIQLFDTVVIRDLTALPNKVADGSWSLEVEVMFATASIVPLTGQLSLNLDGLGVNMARNVTVTPQNKTVNFTIVIPKNQTVELWWPNGYGNQSVYLLQAVFVLAKDITSKAIKVGFRTVGLVQDQVTNSASQGQTFYFKINNVPVFFKGSNWIPADSFQERITRDRLDNLLKSAADVHINSMRVWGGGVYESEDFYDLADQYGIMIWQDFMFSVAMYPATQDFLDTVTDEIMYQMRRLKHHPCIIVWAGSNENEKGLRENWFGTSFHYERYYSDFVQLYVKTIMPIVQAADSTRPYLTSSPSDGDETKREGWVAKDPDSEMWGDIHYYDYLVNQWEPSKFRIPRFASEYGVQSWCSIDSLSKVFADEDMAYWSNMAIHRQHHPLGNFEMLVEVLVNLNMPNNKDRKQKFSDLIYLTQINQAMSIRTQSEHYRRWQSTVGKDGRGLTMGALYWQLNDIWQAPTWSSLEYSGKWKMLHYYAQHFFDPVLLSPYIDSDGILNIYVVVDEIIIRSVFDNQTQLFTFEPVRSIADIMHYGVSAEVARQLFSKSLFATQNTLTLSVYLWSSFTPLVTRIIPYNLSTTAESVFRVNVTKLALDSGCPDMTYCFIHMSRNSSFPAWLPLSPVKSAQGLVKAQIMVTDVVQLSSMKFMVTLGADRVSPFVWLDASPITGRFGDNGFLMTTPVVKIAFHAWELVSVTALRQAISITSLMDIYHEAI